jgi:hypothetical protein
MGIKMKETGDMSCPYFIQFKVYKKMKKTIYAFAVMAAMISVSGCKDDAWSSDPALEHIYYVGFFKAGVFSDALNYEIATDGTARWRVNTAAWTVTGSDGVSSDIPFEFHSERVRSYDVTTFFWVSNDGTSALVAGTDYAVLNESGATIQPADGKYPLAWPQAKKGKQTVRIKRLTSKQGVLKINTLDPAKGAPATTEDKYRESTLNNKTGEYEVRGLSHDFNKETVTFN